MSRTTWFTLSVLTFSLIYGVLTEKRGCPNITFKYKPFITTKNKFNTQFRIVRFKSVDPSIKSPFYFDLEENYNSYVFINMTVNTISQICGITRGPHYSYNTFKISEQENDNRLFLEYLDNVTSNYGPKNIQVFCGKLQP